MASRGRPDLSWATATRPGPDLAGAVAEVHPVVLGVGKKVFDGGAVPTNLTLLQPPVASRSSHLLSTSLRETG